MELYMLSPRDLNLYSTMNEIAECINNYYRTLSDLEYRGLKDSEEYKRTIESLRKTIERENDLYNSSNVTSKLCKAFIALAMKTKIPKKFPTNIESIVTLDEKLISCRRVLTKLQLKLLEDTDEMVNMMPSGIKEVMGFLGENDINAVLRNSIPSSIKIHAALELDMLDLFLSYISESITAKSFESFKESLIRTKYMTSFIEPNIESALLQKQFSIDSEVWINSKIVSDVNRLPDDVFNAFRNILGIETANSQLDKLLTIGDYQYYDSNKNLEVILRSAMLRAALFLVTGDTLENIQDSFNKHTSSVEYEALGYSRKISEATVKEAFSKLPKDKEKHKVVSLRPNFAF